MLTLFYAPGACSMAAHIALEESGEKYTPTKVDLSKGEQLTADYKKIHPLGRVPALLLDDGAPLTENIKTYAVRIENMRVMLKLD